MCELKIPYVVNKLTLMVLSNSRSRTLGFKGLFAIINLYAIQPFSTMERSTQNDTIY